MVQIKVEKGYYLFKLDDILENNNLSKNKVMRDTNTDFKVLQRIVNGDLSKIDVTVLARLCDYFNCSLNDIVEYVPNK
jgi:putative transcriptional regulator